MLSTLYLLFLAALLANPASLAEGQEKAATKGQADPPKTSSRVVIVRFLVRLELAEEQALIKSSERFAAEEPSVLRIVAKINNRIGKASSNLRHLSSWDIALMLPSEELASFAQGLLADLPGQKEAWRALWVTPYGGLGRLSTSSWPQIMMAKEQEIMLPDLVVEPSFLRILTILHAEFGTRLLAKLGDARQRLDLLSSNLIRAEIARDPKQGAICALREEEAKGRKQLPALRLAAGISAAAKNRPLLIRLLNYLCEPEHRKTWILRKTGMAAAKASSLDLLPDAKSEELEAVRRLWRKVPEPGEEAEPYPVLNSLLLLVFGGVFLVLLWTAVKR